MPTNCHRGQRELRCGHNRLLRPDVLAEILLNGIVDLPNEGSQEQKKGGYFNQEKDTMTPSHGAAWVSTSEHSRLRGNDLIINYAR